MPISLNLNPNLNARYTGQKQISVRIPTTEGNFVKEKKNQYKANAWRKGLTSTISAIVQDGWRSACRHNPPDEVRGIWNRASYYSH